MGASKVYFTDFRTQIDVPITEKLKKLCRKAGIGSIDMEGKFVAIKMHFGELGNLAFLRPNYARAIVELVKEAGGNVVSRVAILAEGDAAKRTDIAFLERLPLFEKDENGEYQEI